MTPGGAFVHVSDHRGEPADEAALPLPAPPNPRIRELVRRYLGPPRRAGQSTLEHGTPDREDLVLAQADLARPPPGDRGQQHEQDHRGLGE